MVALFKEDRDLPTFLVEADTRQQQEDSRTYSRMAPTGWRGHAAVPTAFISGALLTLCVLFLAGGSLGVRWQGAPGFAGHLGHTTAQHMTSSGKDAAAAAAGQQDCPKQECPTCPEQQPCPAPAPAEQPAANPAAAAPTSGSAAPILSMPWEPILSQSDVDKGVAYYGSGSRLRVVAQKLLAGKPIKATTLGGSVTRGSGASSAQANYPSRFFQFLNATFPNEKHVFENKGVGATSSGIFSACAEQMVPHDADLVVIEFTMNELPDVPYTDPQRRGYEQLIRKLLRFPGPPAILLVHHYAWWRAYGDGVDYGLFYFPQAEGQLTAFSQYYDIPSLSLRSATYRKMLASVAPFKWEKIQRTLGNIGPTGINIEGVADKVEKQKYFYYDRTHPADVGHKAIAEMLAGAVRRAVEEVASPIPFNPTVWAKEMDNPELKGVPQPMIPGNADAPTTLCAMQEDFKKIVVAAKGFEYKAERPNEETFVAQKWGWTGMQPGDWAELEFDTRSDANANATSKAAKVKAQVYLSHLKSYERMGSALVACVSGCTCTPSLIDGTWEQQSTLMQILRFDTTQHAKCRVRITVRKEPGKYPQEGHKVTMMAIMVSHFPLRLSHTQDQAEEVAGRLTG